MKKLLLSGLAVATLALTANAQKDIELTWDAPAAGSSIEAGVDYDVTFTITNVGADDLVVTDSVFFALTVDGNNLFGSNILLASRTQATVANGESWQVVYPLSFSSIPSSATLDFCAVGLLYEGTNVDPTTEPDMNNNTSCASMDFVAGTNSLDEGFAILGSVDTYPNPASDIVNFEDKGVFAETVVLTDLSGKVVAEAAFANGLAQIDVNALQAGVYMYTIQTENGAMASEKLMVK